jgi:hypothetical protein
MDHSTNEMGFLIQRIDHAAFSLTLFNATAGTDATATVSGCMPAMTPPPWGGRTPSV